MKALKINFGDNLWFKNFLYAKRSHFAVMSWEVKYYGEFFGSIQTHGTNICCKIIETPF